MEKFSANGAETIAVKESTEILAGMAAMMEVQRKELSSDERINWIFTGKWRGFGFFCWKKYERYAIIHSMRQ